MRRVSQVRRVSQGARATIPPPIAIETSHGQDLGLTYGPLQTDLQTLSAMLRRVLAGSSRINRGDRAIIEAVASALFKRATNPPKPPPKPEESATQEAERIVHGPRNTDYGHPMSNDERVASLWRAQFGWQVKTTDVWQAMVLLKLSRERSKPKRDNRVDIAGYAEVGDWIHRTIALVPKTDYEKTKTREQAAPR